MGRYTIDMETGEVLEALEQSREPAGYLTVGGHKAAIGDIGGKRRFSLTWTEEAPDWIRPVLEHNFCPSLLPMRFLAEGEKKLAFYDYDGYAQLRLYLQRRKGTPQSLGEEILRILCAVALGLRSAEEYLVLPQWFSLQPDTIFVHEVTGEVRLAFLYEGPGGRSVKEAMEGLVTYLEEEITDPQWSVYANGIRREMGERNLGLLEIIRLFREKEREMHVRKWPEQALRRDVGAVEEESPQDEEKSGLSRMPWFHKK